MKYQQRNKEKYISGGPWKLGLDDLLQRLEQDVGYTTVSMAFVSSI